MLDTLYHDIEIQNGLLKDETLIAKLHKMSLKLALICDEHIAALYGHTLQKALSQEGATCHLFSFPAGEEYKTRHTKEILEDQLLEKGFGRDCCVIALGGGITTDIAGYLAATYCRGVTLVMIPTSLIAIVDASIGGKNGVNTKFGKNLIGTTYQPEKIFIDPLALQTLPQRELKNGLAEMIKHGLVSDKNYFEFLEDNITHILKLDADVLEQSIHQSISLKKQVVEQDEKEKGLRQILNFGHTVGHALEISTHYQLTHGEAVAIGIVVECYMAMKVGLLEEATLLRIKELFIKSGLNLKIPFKISYEHFFQSMVRDKKSVQGLPRFVMLSDIGSVAFIDSMYSSPVEETIIKEAFDWMLYDLCCY